MNIETPRLLLRPLLHSDVDALVREMNNFAITRNTARVPYPYARSDAEDYLSHVASLGPESLVRAISLKADPEKLSGVISYEFSATKNDAELGYWLAEHCWNQGYGSEAVSAMIEHAFLHNSHETLIACYHNENPHSGRILQRTGFQMVGPCMSFSKAQGREVAVTNMRLTRQDWHNKKAARP